MFLEVTKDCNCGSNSESVLPEPGTESIVTVRYIGGQIQKAKWIYLPFPFVRST